MTAMQTPTAKIAALYNADTGAGGMKTILTGGILTFSDLKRMGLTWQNVPGAFDSNKRLKPCGVIRERSAEPIPDVRDPVAKFRGLVYVVEIILLQDGDSGYSVIDAALLRSYTLLEHARGTGWHDCEFWGESKHLRELEVNDASKHIQRWRITGTRS